MTTDPTQSPGALVRNLLRDLFYALDRLQGAAVRRTPEPDLTPTIVALKYAHGAIHRETQRLTHAQPD